MSTAVKEGPVVAVRPAPESIKRKVELEGVTARNLIKFNVPIEEPQNKLSTASGTTGTTLTPHQHSSSVSHDSGSSSVASQPSEPSSSKAGIHAAPGGGNNNNSTTSSVSRSIQHDYRARYWAQMLDTLRRTIDEIYTACDDDESEMECREVILILDHSKKDFYSLIEKMNVLKNFENLTEEERPPFVAWEERKTNPGKPIMKQLFERRCSKLLNQGELTQLVEESSPDKAVSTTPAQSPQLEKKAKPANTQHVTNKSTWADRVKGVESSPSAAANNRKGEKAIQNRVAKESKTKGHNSPMISVEKPTAQSTEAPDDDDSGELFTSAEGWTSVHRTTRLKSKSSPRPSTSSSTASIKISTSRNFSSPHSATDGKNMSNKDNMRLSSQQQGNRRVRSNVHHVAKRPFTTGGKPLSNDKVTLMPPPAGLHLLAKHERDLSNLTKVQSKSEGAITWHQHHPQGTTGKAAPAVTGPVKSGVAGGGVSYASIASALYRTAPKDATPDIHPAESKPEETSTTAEAAPPTLAEGSEVSDMLLFTPDSSAGLLPPILSSGVALTATTSQPNLLLLRQPSTSSDNEISAEEEEYHKHLQQLDKELADAENTETVLTNELDKATAEAEDYRQQIMCAEEAEEDEDEEKVECDQANGDVEQHTSTSPDATEECVGASSTGTNTASGSASGPGADKATPFALFLSHYSKLKGISWDLLDDDDDDFMLEKVRPPGHGIQMHEKLSSPSRKKLENSIEILEKKQASARQRREQLLSGRTEKIHELTKKVEDVRTHKDGLLEKKRVMMEERLRRAEEKRSAQLEKRIRKAHDEKTKGQEIAFIQSQEAAQKQHIILAKHQESDARIAELQEERRRRQEEKAGVFEERRRQLKESREAYREQLQERWKSRDRDLANKAEDKERSRLAAVKAKEQERESKLAAVNQQRKEEQEKLKTKILKKQEESGRRHQEQLQEISRKAFEMSVLKHTNEESADAPPIEPYAEKKWCRACGVMIESEVFLHSHLRGKKHQNAMRVQLKSTKLDTKDVEVFNLEHIVDAPTDKPDPKAVANKARRKAMKVKTKRLKQRISLKAAEFHKEFEKLNLIANTDSIERAKIQKFVTERRKLLNSADSSTAAAWATTKSATLNKQLGEVYRNLEKGNEKSVLAFIRAGGLSVVCDVIALTEQQTVLKEPKLPDKTFQLSCQMLDLCFQKNGEAALHAILSTGALTLIHALQHRLNLLIPDDFNQRTRDELVLMNNNELPVDDVALALMATLTQLVNALLQEHALREPGDSEHKAGKLYTLEPLRAQDVVSYLVSLGVLDSLSYYLSEVRGPLKETSRTLLMVHSSINLLASLLQFLSKFRVTQNQSAAGDKKANGALSKTSSMNSLPSNGSVSSPVVWFGPSLKCHQVDQEAKDTSSTEQSTKCEDLNDTRTFQLNPNEDPTHFLSTVLATELFGMVRLLYSLLLYSSRQGTKKSETNESISLSSSCLRIALVSLHTINSLALLSLPVMQRVLSEEGTSLQIRHILSYLFTYITGEQAQSLDDEKSLESQLLHEVLLCVGYLVVLHPDNQQFIQTGQPPTLIQHVCQLPFSYFMKPRREILLPTLVACAFRCKDNFNIMRQDISPAMLLEFIKEKQVKMKNPAAEDVKDGETIETNIRFRLENRFPMELWESAISYFEENEGEE